MLRLTSGASRGEKLQITNWKPALFEKKQQLLANGSTGTEDCNVERSIRKRRRQACGLV